MKVVISSGHGKYIRGAAGPKGPEPFTGLDEVDEARRVVDRVAELLEENDVEVVTFHDNTSEDQDTNLATICAAHNREDRELDVSVHFNAYQTYTSGQKPEGMGVECLYVTQEDLAMQMSRAVAEATGLPDRGPKYRDDLYFLQHTEMPAVLLETTFCDAEVDCERYRAGFENICCAIAEVIAGVPINDDRPDRPDRPEEPPPPLTGENRVIIDAAAMGNVSIFVNGQLVHGHARGVDAVIFRVGLEGDVVLTVNGQDYHGEGGGIPENQTDIIATVFGGEGDYNTSAYDPNKVLNDTDLYVALPDRIEGDRPNVRVINRATNRAAEATIEDVGPWNTDDPYWETGTRPQAESGRDMTGRATNGAGIDLSPALAEELGIDGMGTVDWEFV